MNKLITHRLTCRPWRAASTWATAAVRVVGGGSRLLSTGRWQQRKIRYFLGGFSIFHYRHSKGRVVEGGDEKERREEEEEANCCEKEGGRRRKKL